MRRISAAVKCSIMGAAQGRAMLNQFRDMPKIKWWLAAWAVVAIVAAIPVGLATYERLTDVTRDAREKLIVLHQLWESDREYQGTPETWTRVASRVLTDHQLMRRVRTKYGDFGIQVELEYRRDLTIAQAEIAIVTIALFWAAPLAALLALGYAFARLRRRAPSSPPPRRPSYDDARYRP
jgi:hypothetical protein